ncbi:MAG: aspartate carbamoyltransferase catalytic subunit, partial [Fimbriimonadaceae bacterium]|nr:aspartate carbamoyltransferase catalytic subunit [Fimbriimonadaceae bacterium]
NRGVELDDAAADSERSAITAQIENGIFVRMAALSWVFSADDLGPGPDGKAVKSKKGMKVK